MCPNDNPAYSKPLMSRRWESLHDSEIDSDVEFIVGPDHCRIPGHKSVLAAANPVFEAMLIGPMATHDSTIQIEDIDGRAFDNLLRYLYGKDVDIKSIPTALNTLYAAFKYQCGGLVRICIEYLDLNLDDTSVLEIYRDVRVYSDPIVLPQDNEEDNTSPTSSPIPSAPPLETDDSYAGNHHNLSVVSEDITEAITYCGALHHNCLQYIDKHATDILKQEQVEDLEIEILRLIADRENLNLISECILFDALKRWCIRECKKKGIKLTPEEKRAVLGEDLLFSVRYLLMSPNEFLEGPMQSDLLNQSELTVFSAHICNNPPNKPSHLEKFLHRMQTPRGKACEACNHLSKRTVPIIIHREVLSSPGGSSTRRSGRWGKKKDGKKVRKEKSKSCSPDRDRHKRSTGACITEYFFSALSCVFD